MDRPLVSRRKQQRLAMAVAGGVVLALALGAWFWLAPPMNALSVKADQIDTAVVRRTPFQDYLPVRAEVAPLRTVMLGAIEGGQVAKVIAIDGTEVKAGDVLAVLDRKSVV